MSDLPPSIADGTGTVRRVWKNRVIAESDATYAEQLQEDEIAENREYFGQIREAELASLRAAQALQQQEHARVQRQQSLNQDAAARDAAFAQQLLREEALALQRQRDAEARANAEAIRAAATEERRAAAFAAHQAQQSQAQAISSVQSQHSPAVRAGSAPLPQRTGSSSNLNTPPAYSPIAGSAGSSSSGGSNSNITVTITTQSPLQRQATDPGL
ncbi:hypothetical protein CAOG_01934 [Capsaspora owczarzaki ATCC 30864]|uniref:hypothetical protein n=1 Tax=Capsaspora owczarzaki (strain ATCC 30864) TaxID=595528 RepID=UPI0001FE6371|nr:hypothetical protein CAOG_01934 [Capsaspora owczarzaki ATCC 30864]|eukprot:XP_004364802.1 hypothetical protein CAOG_01934 [Capsaspora owczarzaki ATCC 30864]